MYWDLPCCRTLSGDLEDLCCSPRPWLRSCRLFLPWVGSYFLLEAAADQSKLVWKLQFKCHSQGSLQPPYPSVCQPLDVAGDTETGHFLTCVCPCPPWPSGQGGGEQFLHGGLLSVCLWASCSTAPTAGTGVWMLAGGTRFWKCHLRQGR